MQQDFDDYPDSGRSSAVSWMVMVVAALGFLALGWFAFYATEHENLEKEVLTLESYEEAYKQLPDDPGGLEFPHQDKTLYDALDGTERSQRVEKLFPEPEEPILPEMADEADAPIAVTTEGDASSYVANPPAAEMAQEALEKQENLNKKPIVAVPKPAPKPVPVVQKPEPVKQAKPPAAPKQTAVTKAETKPKAAPATAPRSVEVVSPNSPHALQLGAFTSKADASAHWQKIRSKYANELGNYTSSIVKAVLKKGTFYRLRATGFSSKSAADNLCKSLSQKGQACFYVKR